MLEFGSVSNENYTFCSLTGFLNMYSIDKEYAMIVLKQILTTQIFLNRYFFLKNEFQVDPSSKISIMNGY